MNARAEAAASEIAPRLSLLIAMREHAHLSAAAAAVGIPQPTASRWMASLSRAVGTPLVKLVGRRAVLTAAGTALADAAVLARDDLADGVAAALDAGDPDRGQVVFGFLRTMGTSRAPMLLRGYRETAPEVDFTLVQAGNDVLMARLREGSIDLALSSPLPVDEDLETVSLFHERLTLVVPAGHRLARRSRVRLRDCRQETFVGLRHGLGLRQIADELFAEAGLQVRRGFEGEDVATVRGLVAAAFGVAVLPAREHGPLPGSVEVPLSPPSRRTVGLITVRDRPLEPAAEAFRRWATRCSGVDGL